MRLAPHELARIFFAGELDEARIVSADAFEGASSWVPLQSPLACSMAYIVGTKS